MAKILCIIFILILHGCVPNDTSDWKLVHIGTANGLVQAGTRLDYLNQWWPSNHQTSNISHTLIGNKLVDHSNVVGALPALLQLHLHSRLKTWLQWIGQSQLQDETINIKVLGFGVTYTRGSMVCHLTDDTKPPLDPWSLTRHHKIPRTYLESWNALGPPLLTLKAF